MDYESATQLMELHAKRAWGRVNPHFRKLKNRTWLEKTNTPNDETQPEYKLHYFQTNILIFRHDHVQIDIGNFFSHSTHQRLNEFMPRGFRISGCTYPQLRLRRPLGFLDTPTGKYPFMHGMTFTYDGKPYDDLYFHAGGMAVGELTSYVDRYLNQLFSRSCDVQSARAAEEYWVRSSKFDGHTDAQQTRINAGQAILGGTTYSFLALMVARFTSGYASPPRSLTDLSMEDLSLLLAHRGAEVFRKVRTRSDAARRFEDVLEFSMPIPDLNLQKLRGYLRQQLIEYLVSALGFAEVEWNRRDR